MERVVQSISTSGIQARQLTCSIGAEIKNVNLGVASRDKALVAEISRCCSSTRCCSSATRTSPEPSTWPSPASSASSRTTRLPAATPSSRARAHLQVSGQAQRATRTPGTATPPREKPPFGCVLRCEECPPDGSDTMWANMALAYEMLPEHVKTRIDGLARATHRTHVRRRCRSRSGWRRRHSSRRRSSGGSRPSRDRREGPVRQSFTTHFTNFYTPEDVRYGQDFARRGAAELPARQPAIPEYQVRLWRPNRGDVGQPRHSTTP